LDSLGFPGIGWVSTAFVEAREFPNAENYLEELRGNSELLGGLEGLVKKSFEKIFFFGEN